MKRKVQTLSVLIGLLAAVLLSPNHQQLQLLASGERQSGEICNIPDALAGILDIASPPARAQGEEGANSACDDYSVVCEDVAYRTMTSCDYWGLGDCFCKGQRAYNKCMNDVGCPGISALAMARQGCSCLNKSCLP